MPEPVMIKFPCGHEDWSTAGNCGICGRMTTARRARYSGHLVLVTTRRAVTGGVACDVTRHPDATVWPWTVESFTTNEALLEYLD